MILDHIQLAMPPRREEEARSFFAGVLGMTEEPKPPPLDQRGGCWFRAEGVILHVGVEADFQPQRKAHPAFVIPDLDELAGRLKAAGLPVTWDHALSDRRRFYTADPFGNRIEFIQAGDGFHER